MFAAYLYLFLSVLLLWPTLGLVAPRLYGPVLGQIAALPVMAVALFWPHVLFLGLVVTGVVAWQGGLGPLPGRLGLWLHLLSWGLLVYYQLRASAALPILDGEPVTDDEHPFSAGLTEDELQALPAGQAPFRATLRSSFRASVTLRVPAMLAVKVVADVIYREVDGVRLRLDVYRPGPEQQAHREAQGQPLPTAVYIHGGGWITGNRRQSRFMMYELAAAGWVVFAISYRFAPRFPLPAAIHDCKAALCWVRQHAAEYGASGEDLIVLGGSAGGHLAAMMALTPSDPRFQPGFEAGNTQVRGAVVLYGVPDIGSAFGERAHRMTAAFFERLIFKARYRDDPTVFHGAQPMSYISKEVPPLLLIHGRNDTLVPFAESRRFYDKLRAAGAKEVHLLEVPYGVHAFEVVPSPLHQRSVRVILRFMESLRRAGNGGASQAITG